MKYKVVKGLISQKVEDGLTIFDGGRSTLYTLNESASFIFNRLKLGRAERDIVNQLVKKYKIKQEKAKKDVKEFVEDLKKKGIVKPTND